MKDSVNMKDLLNDWRCPQPGCPEPASPRQPYERCTCPTMIYVPAGQHIHYHCPVHGDVVIRGSQATL